VLFDIRGFGASDSYGVTSKPVLETWVDDAGAVLDAIDSEQAVVYGWSHGGQYALMFAATYPERCRALILVNAFARLLRDREYPAGLPVHLRQKRLEIAIEGWGNGGFLPAWAPSTTDDASFREWFSRAQRASSGPGTFAAVYDGLLDRDVRAVLSAISVPTLVIHRGGDLYAPVGHGRYLAEHIDGARYLELPGSDHLEFVGEVDPMLDEIQEFVSGLGGAQPVERVLATVLFTDLVDSTARAAALGDARWRHLLDEHDALGQRVFAEHRGRLVDTTGDGFVAIFDGPARAILAAIDFLRATSNDLGVDSRAGLHTGEIELRGRGIAGIGVHVAARVAALAGRNEVLVSRTVKDLAAGSGIVFADRGAHSLKGVPDEVQLFVANSA
jgi:pimeloyl-ACP methyl ester carboxylesterase